jgi:hypothetical protein
MDEPHDSQPFGRNTCHICGGTEFVWGYVHEFSQHGLFFIESTQPPNIPSWLPGLDIVEPKAVRARCCVTCNNVQFFTSNEDKQK